MAADIDPDGGLGYDFGSRFSNPHMKLSLVRRLVLATAVAVAALFVAGCGSNSAIAPNWYDSSFYKDGAAVGNNNLSNPPTAEPGNR